MAITLYNAIYRRLVADAGVAAIVDAAAIWQDMAKDDAFPMVCIEVEEDIDTALNARSASHYDVMITCTALDSPTRDSLASAVKAAINRAAWTDGNVSVVSVLMNSAPVTSSAESGNAEQQYFESEMSFHIIAGV